GSAEALADDLDRWLRGEPISARPPATTERLLKWVRRRPAVAALVAVSAAAVVVLGVVVAVYSLTLRWKNDDLTDTAGKLSSANQSLEESNANLTRKTGEALSANQQLGETVGELGKSNGRLRQALEDLDRESAERVRQARLAGEEGEKARQ